MAATSKDIKIQKAMAASEGFALALTAAMTVGKQGSHFADISASLLPIVDGRDAHLLLEESTEG